MNLSSSHNQLHLQQQQQQQRSATDSTLASQQPGPSASTTHKRPLNDEEPHSGSGALQQQQQQVNDEQQRHVRARLNVASQQRMADNVDNWRTGGGGGGGGAAPTTGGSSWGHGAPVPTPTGRGGGGKSGRGGKRGVGASGGGGKRGASSKAAKAPLPILPGPSHTLAELKTKYANLINSPIIKAAWLENAKSPLQNYMSRYAATHPTKYEVQEGNVEGRREKSFRATITVDPEHQVVAYGDAATAKDAEKTAAFHGVMLLAELNLINSKPSAAAKTAMISTAAEKASGKAAPAGVSAKLSTGAELTPERAREFMQFYCKNFGFGIPDIRIESTGSKRVGKKTIPGGWTAEMEVGGQNIGRAVGQSKKLATSAVYVDTVQYLESCDPQLWKTFDDKYKPGAPIGSAPHVYFRTSEDLDDEVGFVYESARNSLLFRRRPRPAGHLQPGEAAAAPGVGPSQQPRRYDAPRPASAERLKAKSERLLAKLDAYQADDRLQAMREQRRSLPVQQKASDVLVKIELNQVTIVMAATGSGKTTQIPQILFDDYILRGEGAHCNIICTQPRRIAAISVAQRVAKERGERIGETVGYQVRFDAKTPEPNGSITFCTTGVFLRRLQSALGDESQSNSFLDELTHVVVDEVHERDIETDLLLVVIKKLLAERKKLGKKEIKLVLMSATIDPTLFQNYFTEPPPSRRQAPVVDVPGRSFPVDKHYLEETIARLHDMRLPHNQGGWVWNEKNVRDYLERELNQRGGVIRPAGTTNGASSEAQDLIDDLELPYPLIALMIADVLKMSKDGHVLVFMPGWDEIKAVNQILQDTAVRPLMGLDFNDPDRFEVHILHSSIPVADQQAVFDPPRNPNVRRIILSTNIAETSVTIPDVVYVVDTGRVKEKRYDAERGLSSLVSAWVGTSNLNQRAGRAGRHRPGEYYGVLSKARYEQLNVTQTVEMKRSDLSNVVMHIKALDIPGMEVEDVLDAAIEPPAPERVRAAMDKLFMVGALDENKDLTSLGHVLLQLPVDASMGKMCLYGAFFRCLDPTLTLAAILTSRDPFMAPMALKKEADRIKDSWCPPDFRSDALTILRAYNRWWEMASRGDYHSANRFCHDNFLSKVTLQQIQQVKEHLFSSLEKAGIIEVTLGASQARKMAPQQGGMPTGPATRMRGRYTETSPELNVNSQCEPLLAALIAVSSTPNFAIRASEKVYRTSLDKACFIHPSSVCHSKHTKDKEGEYLGERELFAFTEKIRNVSMMTSGSNAAPQINLRGVTRLDPLTYMLFGANTVTIRSEGITCDGWLPVRGHFDTLDSVERLKAMLDVCMLRVMEGCSNYKRPNNKGQLAPPGNEDDPEVDRKDLRLSLQEIEEFERLTAGVVNILDRYAVERAYNASRGSTRPATPSQGYPGSSGHNSAGGPSYGGASYGSANGHGYGGSASGSGYNSPWASGSQYGGPPANHGGSYNVGASSLSLGGGGGARGGSGYSSQYNSRPASPPSAAQSWRRGG